MTDDPTPTDSTNSEIIPDSTSEPITEDMSEENAKTPEKLEDSFEKDDNLENEDIFSDDDENGNCSFKIIFA